MFHESFTLVTNFQWFSHYRTNLLKMLEKDKMQLNTISRAATMYGCTEIYGFHVKSQKIVILVNCHVLVNQRFLIVGCSVLNE